MQNILTPTEKKSAFSKKNGNFASGIVTDTKRLQNIIEAREAGGCRLVTGAEEFLRNAKLDLSVGYIHDHIAEKLSVEELSAMEYLGASRYREVFGEIMGISPSEYITRLRVERAKDLLSLGGLSISEVAETVGYKVRLYFQRVFKKCTGKTPPVNIQKCKTKGVLCKQSFAKNAFYISEICFLIASNDASLRWCSILQASLAAVSSSTPRETRKFVISLWRS